MFGRRAVGALAVLAAAAAGAAAVLSPARREAVLRATRRSLRRLLREVPDPVVLGAGIVLGTLVGAVLLVLLGKLCFRLWLRVRGRVLWLVRTVLPGSPLMKFATGVMLLVALTVVIVAGLPAAVQFDDPAGATGYAQELSDRALNAEWQAVIEGDTVAGGPVCRGQAVDGPDRDGDGLPDRWERAGRTPNGTRLPGADPGRKDLYVQLNYGTNVEPLNATERDQLRRVWARMPVGNPDGSTGIDIHLVEDGGGGSLGEPAVFTRSEGTRRYYDRERMGSRLCVYHQVTYGRLEMGDVVGRGSMPGYSTIVDGRRYPDYTGAVSLRVAVTTHELLHNVAGRVNGQPHTDEGWLRGGSDDEYLSAATAADLNETGLFGPV